MLYNNFKDIKLSALGLGTMRLPIIDGDDSKIDVEKTKEIIKYALNNGINYFDTAFGYHGGTSESVVGECLSEYDRKSFYLATKFPGFNLENVQKKEEIFNKQLEKCKTDYFDFYLFHCLSDKNVEWYTDDKLGLYDYLSEQKALGKINYLGFSAHCSFDVFKRFLEKYGKNIDFCQLQLNYLDYKFQDAKAKVELLREYNIPIWVMEPVRGGKLACLDEEYEKELKKLRPNENIPAWAFRYLQTFPDDKMILSGMSNMEQLKDNINTFSEFKPLNDNELITLNSIADKMIASSKIPCTACKYCIEKCPKGIDIPSLISKFNDDNTIRIQNPCIACKACENVCPQGIKISKIMAKIR